MSAAHLPCRCGNARGDVDIGSALCTACRYYTGEVTTSEVQAAFARCDRSQGGVTPRVGWITPRAPGHLWRRCPPSKEEGVRVLVLPIDVADA